MKLGEVLISEGVIGETQLKEALDAQLIYGGHLGTCLIELGFLNEERLGQALASAFAVPYAPLECFLEIPRYVVNTLPSKIVQKHSAVPFRVKDKVLDVALIDPKNLQAIDEIRFVSGYAIQSWIAPEVRIFHAMERYYDIPRRIRYVTLCRTLDKGRSLPAGAPEEVIESQESAPAAEATVATRSVAESLVAVSDLLCKAKSEDQIADLVLTALEDVVPRCVLLKVQGSNGFVWKSAGARLDPHAVGNVKFPILSEPIFGLLRGDDHYAGPLPSDPKHLAFYRKLGIEPPSQLLLLPVHLNDQLIAMFYADGGPAGTIGSDVEGLRRLLAKAALAIDIVQTKVMIHAL